MNRSNEREIQQMLFSHYDVVTTCYFHTKMLGKIFNVMHAVTSEAERLASSIVALSAYAEERRRSLHTDLALLGCIRAAMTTCT